MELLFGQTGPDDEAFDRMLAVAERKYGEDLQVAERGDDRIASTTMIEDDNIVIAFNGQLNNHDVSNLPELYQEHGIQMVKLLDGHFRIAVISEDGQTIATDHIGAKQLFYTHRLSTYSSQLVPMMAADGDPELDRESMRQFLINGNNFTTGPRTMIEGVRKVLPAHWRRSDGTSGQYHRLPIETDDDITLQQAADMGYEALQQAVSDILDATGDVPYVLSSGGMDSALLAGLFDQQADITTLTYGWEDSHFPEGRRLADTLGIDHEELHLDYFVPDRTDAYFLEEPHSMFLNFPVRALKQHGYEVVTSGLMSPAAFPIGNEKARHLSHAERVRPAVRAATRVGAARVAEQVDPSYRIGLEAVADEHDTGVALAHNTYTITTRETRELAQEEPEQDHIQAVEDRWYRPAWYRAPVDQRLDLLQLRQRDIPKYHNIFNQVEHHDLFTQRGVLEQQLQVPLPVRRRRQVMDRIMADRFPELEPDPEPSGYSAWIDIFWKHMASDQTAYRQRIESFLERGWLDPDGVRDRVYDPTDYRYERFGGVIVFLENWMQTFIDRDEPWRDIA